MERRDCLPQSQGEQQDCLQKAGGGGGRQRTGTEVQLFRNPAFCSDPSGKRKAGQRRGGVSGTHAGPRLRLGPTGGSPLRPPLRSAANRPTSGGRASRAGFQLPASVLFGLHVWSTQNQPWYEKRESGLKSRYQHSIRRRDGGRATKRCPFDGPRGDAPATPPPSLPRLDGARASAPTSRPGSRALGRPPFFA